MNTVKIFRKMRYLIVAVIAMMTVGCVSPRLNLFSHTPEPFKEYTLSGQAKEKVLVIPIRGIISDFPRKGMLRTKPGMVQDVVAQLHLAEKDPEIHAVLLKIDSPGGSVTASDILYHEIELFKEKTGDKVVTMMMNVAASGGYYIALPSDYIMAHPTSVTGSVGVIFMRPELYGLMDKLGIGLAVNTSGANKDMGSPFRGATEKEKKIFQTVTDTLGKRFIGLVRKNRHISPENLAAISTARIYLANEAVNVGLVDGIGYLEDAVNKARQLANLPKDSQVVIYRRAAYPDDTIYNSQQMRYEGSSAIVDLGLPASFTEHLSGFYYLWTPGIERD